MTVVVPCYNEEEVLQETNLRLSSVLDELIAQKWISAESSIFYVDDGSKDRTWEIICELNRNNKYVSGLKLARNAGHQNALFAGLTQAREYSDCIISVDADLQDDLAAIPQMIEKYREGYEVVYGVRRKRETDTLFKRVTAEGFYKVMNKMGANIVYNHADFRLLGNRALSALMEFKEVNLFIRGVVPMVGFKSTNVYYDRADRFAGQSKYPLKKMLAFAFDGITSLSVTPIRMVTLTGVVFAALSMLAALYAVIVKLNGNSISGWASIMVSLWFIGGVQLMCLGMIGEYIGKIYKETKHRPKYILEEELPAQCRSDRMLSGAYYTEVAASQL
ncbi:putative glycosyltransferase YkoT [Paenibacillus curdlanolyticus]|nr:putative glycosyltransferase YkoT [Paenibacillus curdlanolyticus]